jgi:hypothetical protein
VQGEQLHALALKLEELVREFRIDRNDGGDGARVLPVGATAALPERSSERRKSARG